MNPTTTQRINDAAKLLIADIWHDLPGCDDNSFNWESYFRLELAQLVQDQSFHKYRGWKLIRWVRNRAIVIYQRHIKQPYHLGSHRAGYQNRLSVALMSVLEVTPLEAYYMGQCSGFLFYTYMHSAMNQGAIGYKDFENVWHSAIDFSVCPN